MLPTFLSCKLIAQSPPSEFSKAYDICEKIASRRNEGVIFRTSTDDGSFISWEERTNFTHEASVWYTHVEPATLQFRRALGALRLPPARDVIFAVVSPFAIITTGLSAALPKLSSRITERNVTTSFLHARLGHLVTNNAGLREKLMKLEIRDDNRSSITYTKGRQALLAIPNQLYLKDEQNARDKESVAEYPGITSISLKMDDGTAATVHRDLSIEVFSTSSPLEEIAAKMQWIGRLVWPSSEAIQSIK